MKKPAKTNEPQTGGTLEPLNDERSHTDCFAKAAKLFSQGEFAKARDIFQRAAHGPVLSVNESASMYVRMCEQRLDRQRQETATPEELYNRGMALLKQRRYTEALASLEAAQRAEETARVRYALTLATGNIGDAGAAARLVGALGCSGGAGGEQDHPAFAAAALGPLPLVVGDEFL